MMNVCTVQKDKFGVVGIWPKRGRQFDSCVQTTQC